MTNYPRAAYGGNPHPNVNPNSVPGWGSWQWPGGVPASLLAVVTGPSGEKFVIRKELAELLGLMLRLAKVKYGRDFTRGWTGGYNNRAIAGSSTPSNHSRGRAIDVDASQNPMSSTFRSDLPPGMVAEWESLGWYWGGRYSGKSDTMHFEAIMHPLDLPRFVEQAHRFLAPYVSVDPSRPAPAPAPAPAPVPTTTPAYPGLLVRGSKGAGVRQLQARLNEHRKGAREPLIAVDGDFGPATERAVRWFQFARRRELAVDGKVGPHTWASLWR